MVECYNIKEDEPNEEEDPRKVDIREYKGFREVRGPVLSDSTPQYSKPMKTTEVDIGTS